MHVYAMSYFKLPKSTCDSLSSAMADFWWNSLEEKRRCIGLTGRSYICQNKMEALASEIFNVSTRLYLQKNAWRILQEPQSLCSRILKIRYFANLDFLQAELGIIPSYAWKSLLHGRELLEK